MAAWIDHLAVAPILLPLAASALMLLFDERRRGAKLAVAMLTTIALVGISIVLVGRAGSAAAIVYAIGGWPAPFGITLIVDRLSAMMLALASVLGLASLIYASARWDRGGPRFHALFLLQLMGLNGAFLTGDLFNLFVFFEVLLAASYGLLLHGSGRARVSAALHYVTINVATSLLFLVGASLIYGTTGTLNIADLAIRMPSVPESDRMLLQSGLAILGVAFLIKAAMWPVGFWLPTTYSAASPPVAALFAILSKVGVYAVLRVLLLGRGGEAADPASIAGQWLQAGGMATILFGTIGVLASRTLSRLAGFSLIISSGILLATIAGGGPLAGALFYLVSSTLAVGALYLLIEPIARNEAEPNVAAAADPVFEDEVVHDPDDEGDEVGVVIPATLAILGGGFLMCALLLAGLPPLSGFVAKFAIIDGLLDAQPPIGWARWTLIALIIVSGMATIIAASRAGIDLLWASERAPRTLRLAEAAPVGLLLALCLGLTVFAGPAYVYMEAAARALPGAAGPPPGVAR
ncbi:monovalent cation/H+ antiporter subunit D [Sphingomonas sp. MAH-20]|uniref:Monovalent cation/H+ antiporter subunit D n=1 Tax=Sphingomonas horti TaxID=2682842 RepID=A0A6I4IXY7_9SPHN|nr:MULTISPECIES: monovalent cation/H+ antiporter subunit D [Sphingomonas]MBA2918058.1 monovalent cation/H+ antiporter subunit D [Sphingomonas sp. CGMCC 1.13658]MVO77029.1 monovalent cation/H+ antiporter subunit D [Sphingomonas horti]